ncbi:type II toxin-antitoxin system VapC family toxin [Acidithiobacillus ferrianus]|uniref:Ribonuclease VapC n=2 Tax=Acidithiobacillus ferrianus TaxID=2678518 RepID=A0A845U8N1_9PROT|nr:type II toxin-antitoxin system VapC family toxin [Acidithiobacillus ferrianus]MBN6742096.1 type II toxin-antitoxin system VapC family toxin [Acidithiobacillus sp. MC6.1]NDU44042.1 PIN domain-containing protein [Acidithiobacillus ferrianus]
MIILDTNVVSELLRPSPSEQVMSWIASQPLESLYTTSITQAEMLYGARILPEGNRRSQLESAIAAIFAEDLAGRVLPFDGNAARVFAEIAAQRKLSGRPVSQADVQIAAITKLAKARLATRNIPDFEGVGISLVNPWSDRVET